MIRANVSYLHIVDTNKWKWALADSNGKPLCKCMEEFNTFEEAEKDYTHHHQDMESKLKF